MCCWSHPCTELSRQSVTEFISAKIPIQACTRDADWPSNKYYWLVIIIFYCWYAEGCGVLQLDFYIVPWKIYLIIVFILAVRFILIAGWGWSLRFVQKPKAEVKLTPLNLRADKSSPKRAARDLGLTLHSHLRTKIKQNLGSGWCPSFSTTLGQRDWTAGPRAWPLNLLRDREVPVPNVSSLLPACLILQPCSELRAARKQLQLLLLPHDWVLADTDSWESTIEKVH